MILILGGTKSGKTAYAEKIAKEYSLKNSCSVVYMATAQAWDEEMKVRIRKHKESRPDTWITFEEPLNICSVFNEISLQNKGIILFDCLTMWMSNLLMTLDDNFKKEEAETFVIKKMQEFLEGANLFQGEIVIISNLTETGLISPSFLGRTFQDLSGICHQMIASKSDSVYQLTAGMTS
ncbi:MAG: hypothetical protein B6241_02635 [Spirochaetaceae bacterium 4572_59]|nr:MAG: hypothetical protein B6241_02635 [Spirochaetaceae bacterium 4572_59]